ncbi:2-oxoacid:acceptor oxidoreductase subunit alpha [Patescibacteria group bacterium]|nr:2-oxoacid:acceptor oxidoreductase subunit alpha [Patescibacteria group bacterium]MBU1895700.1 2-oxoacid:acceptor oxidoreductase subunit alpha [Patescibacteria group bacterium]
MQSFNIKIGGSAGEGIKSSGLILARAFTRMGYSVFGYSEYPSLIRGGHNTYQLNVGIEEVFSQVKELDILIALNQETITLHQDELTTDSLVLYNPDHFELPKGKLKGKYLPIAFTKLAEESGGKAIMANIVSLASALALLELPIESLKQAIAKEFADKPKEITALNHSAAKAGEKYILENCKKFIRPVLRPKTKKKQMLLTGNEAAALGAIAGGLQFYSSYPMTPATSIIHYLAGKAKQTGIFVKHVEDEISAVNMAIGASYAGVRSMASTSGGGLCLMAEGLGLAGISETPLVVIDSMRPGPGGGMPTWSGQGDLKFAINISNDESPRIVLAPGDGQECFDLAKLALELAEKYQTLVIILLDKHLSEGDFCVPPFPSMHQNKRYGFVSKLNGKADASFKRYTLTKDGISLRPKLGQSGGVHVNNSYEHDEFGFATEDGDMRVKMADKRMKKMKLFEKEIMPQQIFGNKKAKKGIISFGSNKGPILEAMKNMPDVKFMHLNFVWPFPTAQVKKFTDSVDEIYCLECNATGQLASLIKENVGITPKKVLKYDGRPFYPGEIKIRIHE